LTLETWLNHNYDHLALSARNITFGHELAEELLHYSLDELMHKSNLQEILDSGGATFYTVRIMLNQWKSTTSPFYRIYRQPSDEIQEGSLCYEDPAETEEEMSNKMKVIHKELDKLPWYDRTLFEIFYQEGHTMSSLSRETGIPRTSISLTINRVREHLKKTINNGNY